MEKSKLNPTAEQNPRWPNLQSAIKLAKKKGVLEFCLDQDEFEPEFIEPTNNIKYPSRQGYSSEDISGYCMPDSFKEYIQANINSFKENQEEFGILTSLSFMPWSLPWKSWIWCLSSTKYIANNIVDEKYRPKTKKADHDFYYNNHEKLVAEVTNDEIFAYLDKNYLKMNENIWVNPKDYSDFQYNHLTKPYKLKDGWSLRQVEEIMQEWIEIVMKEKIPVRHVRR